MIPQLIHYCWFGGGEKGRYFERCINSWKRYCPNYKIIEWNETNFDIYINNYCKEAYEQKKFAFVSDVCRVYVLKKYGGIYFDTDVELIKGIDDLLQYHAFMGCEDAKYIASGLGCGFEKDDPFLIDLFEYYNRTRFINSDGSLNLQSCPEITTMMLCDGKEIVFNNIKKIKGIMIFPQPYFSPSDFWIQIPMINSCTYAIHHYEASWIPKLLHNERQMCQSEKSRVLFVSPHYDDAIGSCGGWINHLVENGIIPTVLTVFGKKYMGTDESNLIKAVHEKWKSEDIRELENVEACKVLGCDCINYEEYECIYRKDEKRFLYPNVGDEFDSIHRSDLSLIDRIYNRIKNEYYWPRILYFPLAIGHQVDHVIVNEVGRKLYKDGFIVMFYHDFTYEGNIADEYIKNTYVLSNDDYLNKIEAMSKYHSQVSMLFGTKEKMMNYLSKTGKNELYYRLA